jgi:hypothetical protein
MLLSLFPRTRAPDAAAESDSGKSVMKLQSPELEQRILDTTRKTGPGAGRENFARMVRKITTSPQWAACGVGARIRNAAKSRRILARPFIPNEIDAPSARISLGVSGVSVRRQRLVGPDASFTHSSSGTVVVVQHAAQALALLDRSCSHRIPYGPKTGSV